MGNMLLGAEVSAGSYFDHLPNPTRFDKYVSDIIFYMVSEILSMLKMLKAKAAIEVFVFGQFDNIFFFFCMAAIYARLTN